MLFKKINRERRQENVAIYKNSGIVCEGFLITDVHSTYNTYIKIALSRFSVFKKIQKAHIIYAYIETLNLHFIIHDKVMKNVCTVNNFIIFYY